MDEKIVLMTGATSGFGKVIAQHVVSKKYKLIVFARSSEKASQLNEELNQVNDSKDLVTFIPCDLSSFQSIISACDSFKEQFKKVDILIHNAGIMNFSHKETTDGIEETLQVNLLAPMLITHLLYELIDKGSEAKIIFTSSGLHQGTIQFDDIEFKSKFSSFKSYRQSKLGIILMTRLLSKHLQNRGISVYCVHPGMVRTELGRSAGWFSKLIYFLMGSSPKKGASTHLILIDQKQSQLISGEYYSNSKVTKTTKESFDMDLAIKMYNVIIKYLSPFMDTNPLVLKINEKTKGLY